MDETLAHPGKPNDFRVELAVILVAAAIFLGCLFSPPALLDDVDAVHGQIARNMLDSGDWVTARLNGVPYFEKPPFKYWMIAGSYLILGVHDWAARLPIAFSIIALCWLTALIGTWAGSAKGGLIAGLALATSVGFLFTRILIADVILLAITLAMWGFLRALEEDEPHPRRWMWIMAASIGTGLLLKGLIAALFPVGSGSLYLLLTRQLLARRTWERLRPFSGTLILLVIAVPWHVLATIRNPPYFYFSMRSIPGEYHGFFWFYFFNEHILRFLSKRYPHASNTMPRVYFWLFHALWFFPLSAYFAAAARLSYRPVDRAGRMRLIAPCCTAFVPVFFTLSSTQEYYSMPGYPAWTLLIGCATARGLTLKSFSYLRVPLVLAGIAFLVGASAPFLRWPIAGHVLMLILFVHAARLAMVVFDPYRSSRPRADARAKAPPGRLIEDNAYDTFSSVFFYDHQTALLLNSRKINLEYGSNAPGVPRVFIDDGEFAKLWHEPERYHLLAAGPPLPRIQKLVPPADLHLVSENGGKFLLTNHANSR